MPETCRSLQVFFAHRVMSKEKGRMIGYSSQRGEYEPEKDPVADTAVQHTGILPYAAFAILSLGAVLYIVNRKRTHE